MALYEIGALDLAHIPALKEATKEERVAPGGDVVSRLDVVHRFGQRSICIYLASHLATPR
jgi:hypothetical protein